MKSKQFAWVFVAVVALTSCSAHNPFIIKDTTEVRQPATTKYAPHNNRVWVMTASMPATAKYEVLGQLEVGKVWYGSSDNVLNSLADGARQLGADAVVEVKTWHQVSGWSWSAPHGSGEAIKVMDPASVDFPSLGGDWK